MNKCLVAIAMFLVSSVYAQENKGYDRIYFSYSKQNYRDKHSIKYDGLLPEGHIYPSNMDSHNWGLQYERATRYGLSMAIELQYGVRRYNMNIVQDMTNFDPEAINNLKNYSYSFGNHAATTNYWGPKLLIGYRKKWKNNWAVTAKIGLSVKLFYDDYWFDLPLDFEYLTDNGKIRSVSATSIEFKYGRPDTSKKWSFPNTLPSYECYIGIEREFNIYIIKSLSIGVEGARGWWMWGRHESAIIYTSPTINQLDKSKEIFIDRNISIGLHVSVGLWR